jgi:cytoskeleton protein RodZ
MTNLDNSRADNTVADEIKSTRSGPGDLLQAGRTEMGLSLEDVASRMHLSVDIIEAIEENNFSDITAPIFVKGYLRAYAKIVSLDENELIQQYLEYYSNEDPPIASTSKLLPEISPSDRRIKWVTYLFVILLAGLLAFWWWNKYQSTTDVVSLEVQQSSEIQQLEIVEQSAPVEIEVESEVTVDTSATDTSGVTSPTLETDSAVETELSVLTESPESPLEADPAPEVDVEPEVAVLTVAEPVQEGDDTDAPRAEVESEVLQETDAESIERSDAIMRMTVGSDQLGLIINADSWVEINDANGNRMVYRLVRAYQKFNLTGKAPFTVFFGNGYGVEVTFNDEPIDIISRIRSDNTVRMKVGG